MTIEFLAIIPARSGSKEVINKNVKKIRGKPLIYWTINEAKKSKKINKIIVSTDSKKYAKICEDFGIEVPFIRPKYLAKDETPSYKVAVHSLEWFFKQYGYFPKYILLLQPTSPFRNHNDIDKSIDIALENNADSVVSVEETKTHPYYLRSLDKIGRLKNYIKHKKENLRRQDLESVFSLNGAIFLVKTKYILKGNWFGENCYPLIMPQSRSLEIDTKFDFQLAELIKTNI